MPELPEVETIKRGLEKFVIAKTIKSVDFDWPKSFQGEKKDIIGTKITDVRRRAKMIVIKLKNNSNNLNLLFHLKMTGQLIYRGKDEAHQFAGGHPDHEWHAKLPTKHTRIIFEFSDKTKLFFNDLRKFGWCKVLTDEELKNALKKFSEVEPFTDKFNVEYLKSFTKKIPNRKIKQLLMDQELITGIGNIYADEILFAAGVLPTRKIKDIKPNEWQIIHDKTLKILKKAIKHGGTTDSDYVNADGHKGGMQNHLKVYHRKGEACLNKCGGKVERIKIGGRGTHFCPKCQK